MTLDHPRGAGILITIDPPAKVPTADDYLKEVLADMKKQKAEVTGTEKPKRLALNRSRWTASRWMRPSTPTKRRIEYSVPKQADGGATIAANLPADDMDLRPEAARIVRSLSVTRKIEEKEVGITLLATGY